MSTRVGYAAGTTLSPTYHQIGDHAECTQVDFDPSVVSYEELLNRFFEWHNAFREPYARQYMSAILWHSEEQKSALEEAIRSREDEKRKVRSELQPYTSFTWAEDYHQKYYLRRNKVVARELKERFPSYEEFVNSTAVARANACLGGFWEPTEEELRELGFSPKSATELKSRKKSFFGSLLDSVVPGRK